MSVGPLGGLAGSAAGSPLSQTSGSEAQRAQQETGAQQRQVYTEKKAESAAGIGETDGEDHETAERDADGRRLLEEPPEPKEEASEDKPEHESRQSKDPTGKSGNLLDLTG